jgi:2-deoxy-D-gluconate 3-dehydrogenase
MVLEEMSLKGKVALITGGGSGIGGGITKGLAEAGAAVACVYDRHKPDEMQAYVKQMGGQFLAIHADVSQMAELPVILERTLEQFGRLDILVNNAGICPRASALDYTEEMWDSVIRLNEKSVFFLSQLAAKQFLKQKTRGKIINLASMMSYLGGFNTSAYTASKHAVVGITRVLASEWGSMGINVNALAPGWIKTNLSAPLRADPQRNATVRARIPQGDWGDPEDFKGVAVLLASEAADYINGVTIPVDGGYLTK